MALLVGIVDANVGARTRLARSVELHSVFPRHGFARGGFRHAVEVQQLHVERQEVLERLLLHGRSAKGKDFGFVEAQGVFDSFEDEESGERISKGRLRFVLDVHGVLVSFGLRPRGQGSRQRPDGSANGLHFLFHLLVNSGHGHEDGWAHFFQGFDERTA